MRRDIGSGDDAGGARPTHDKPSGRCSSGDFFRGRYHLEIAALGTYLGVMVYIDRRFGFSSIKGHAVGWRLISTQPAVGVLYEEPRGGRFDAGAVAPEYARFAGSLFLKIRVSSLASRS